MYLKWSKWNSHSKVGISYSSCETFDKEYISALCDFAPLVNLHFMLMLYPGWVRGQWCFRTEQLPMNAWRTWILHSKIVNNQFITTIGIFFFIRWNQVFFISPMLINCGIITVVKVFAIRTLGSGALFLEFNSKIKLGDQLI